MYMCVCTHMHMCVQTHTYTYVGSNPLKVAAIKSLLTTYSALFSFATYGDAGMSQTKYHRRDELKVSTFVQMVQWAWYLAVHLVAYLLFSLSNFFDYIE